MLFLFCLFRVHSCIRAVTQPAQIISSSPGSLLARKKLINPQENSAELDTDESKDDESRHPDDCSSDETQRSTPEDSSASSMEPEWTEDETTDGIKQEGDLCRVRRRTLCGTFGFRSAHC